MQNYLSGVVVDHYIYFKHKYLYVISNIDVALLKEEINVFKTRSK